MNDLIEKILKGVYDSLYNEPSNYIQPFIKGTEYAIELIKSHSPWHKWPEEKPENSGWYLVVPKNDDDITMACYGFTYGQYWYEIIGNQKRIEITHWMPLPSPPKE